MRWMAGLLLTGALLLVSLKPAVAAPPSPVVQVTFPQKSANGNLDFWKIPWKSGEKVNGAIEVSIAGRVQNLTIRPVGAALSQDQHSRRVIARNKIDFTRADADGDTEANTNGAAATGRDAAADVLEPGRYLFDFTVDGIPGEDTYVFDLQAAGQVWDEQSAKWVPFVDQLSPVKLKVFSDADIWVSTGNQLQAQWTNLEAPFGILQPLERLVNRSEENFRVHTNPSPTVMVELPGTPGVVTTQTFRVDVWLDPVLDENQKETNLVEFVIDNATRGGDTPSTYQSVEGLGNSILAIRIIREYTVDAAGNVTAHRIPPGTYKTKLYIQPEWASEPEMLPVELEVKDASIWPLVTLIVGVLVSLLSNYWQRRQPLFQALAGGRRWRRYYLLQGLRINTAERVMTHLSGCVNAGDEASSTKAAALLEEMMRNLPATYTLEAATAQLTDLGVLNETQMWASVVSAATVAEAFKQLADFCTGHPDPAVKQVGAQVAQGGGYLKAGAAALDAVRTTEVIGAGLRQWWSDLMVSLRRTAPRIASPGFWDVPIMVLLFVAVNGSLIALQLYQTYAPNPEFGDASDYMNLLFWGFAGDTARTKLTDLAAMIPVGKKPTSALPAGRNDGVNPGDQSGK